MANDTDIEIYSWNVNGIRACVKNGFRTWFDAQVPEIVGLQEVRASAGQIEAEDYHPAGHRRYLVEAQRAGYSGVAIYARREPDDVVDGLGIDEFDSEGRFQMLRFGRLCVANVYFPNGNGKDRDNSRVPYKLEFYRAVLDKVTRQRKAGRRVLVMGDYNTAHRDIDLARPKQNRKTSGFLPEECEELDRWLEAGWIDTFRAFEPGPDHYSWWSQRGGARQRNVGWRIDYILASPNLRPFLRAAKIHPGVMGSDHCPISVTLDAAVWS